MESTPEEVFRSYEIKDLSKKSAVEMLISFVESSDDDLLRVNSIKLISKLDHSLYLGRELAKAEICLYLGKSYSQDISFKDS